MISPDTIYLCNGKLSANYATDSVTIFTLHGSTVNNQSCTNDKAFLTLQNIAKGNYYRRENPDVLSFYGKNAREAQLTYVRPFSQKNVPVVKS